MKEKGTNSVAGPELLVELSRTIRTPLRAQLEDGLREAVRSGRLSARARLPATRALASDLGVSRRLVVDAYAQLLAEGYLVARPGAGTFVADAAGAMAVPNAEPEARTPRFDFFPGFPDLASFPRREWLRAMRETLRHAPDRAFGYPDPRGAAELRRALAEHLRRVRGVAVDPQSIVVCSGAAQGFVLLSRALRGPRIAVEDPGLPPYRAILTAHGSALAALGVDEHGARVEELGALAEQGGRIDAVLVTPAHQSPTGVALAPGRRSALLEWAGESGGVVIEDDYDAEYRYDRAAIGALQGLDPDRVIYAGSASKTLAPALRIGWLVVSPSILDAVSHQKLLADRGTARIEQHAFADFLTRGELDRHLRRMRARYRSRRDALIDALTRALPETTVLGAAAGLHVTVQLPDGDNEPAIREEARERRIQLETMSDYRPASRGRPPTLLLGYAQMPEPAIRAGVHELAQAVQATRTRA